MARVWLHGLVSLGLVAWLGCDSAGGANAGDGGNGENDEDAQAEDDGAINGHDGGIGGNNEVPCPLTHEAKDCWDEHTGVRNGTGFTAEQIVAGDSDLIHVTSQETAPAGTTWSDGVLIFDTDDAVVDGIWLDGCVAIRANNITLQNSLIRAEGVDWDCTGGNREAGASAINTGNSSDGEGAIAGAKFIDVEVDGQDANDGGFGAANYTCIRCNVHGFRINMWATWNDVIRDSFVHGNNLNAGDGHADGINCDSGSNVSIQHSWIAMDGSQEAITAAVSFNDSWGAGDSLKVDKSYMEGYGGSDLTLAWRGNNHTNLVVTNNAFSTNNGWGGTTAVTAGTWPLPGNFEWSGNYMAETEAEFEQPW